MAGQFVSLLLLALLLFLLFGGSRVNAAGKGLGQAVRHVKRAVDHDTEPNLDPVPLALPIMTASSEPERKEPKLLPAKGESSASAVGALTASAVAGEAEEDKT